MKRRWSDNQKQWGPLTYARGDYRCFSVTLNSGHDEYLGCNLRVQIGKHTLITELPQIVNPSRNKIKAVGWDAATVERLGRDWYYDEHECVYGFSISDGFLNVSYGARTNDSDTDKHWGYFLPWMQWRHVRRSWYGPDGRHIETLRDTTDREERKEQWEWLREFEKGLCLTEFVFDDFDGQRIVASTHIEEREWRFGAGCWKWLSVFRKPRIHRSLDIVFSAEVGPRKGSWKGGTVGHSIDMLPGELHEAAFKRYCEKHNLTFVQAK